jgi:hypothetical protein
MIRSRQVFQRLNYGDLGRTPLLADLATNSLTGFTRLDPQTLRDIESQCVSSDSGNSIEDDGVRDTLDGSDKAVIECSKASLESVWGLSMSSKCSLMIPPDDSAKKKDLPPNMMTREAIKARWHNLDPVDMEAVERDHYLKTGQVLRTRHVQARATLAPPGARLRQVLATHVLDTLDTLSVKDLGTFLSLLASTRDPHALFHRDLKIDAQFKICKKLCTLRDEDIASILIPTTAALISFDPHTEIPSRVWRRKIIPVIRRSLKDETIRNIIDSTDSSLIPLEYREWDAQSLRSVIVSNLLSSGRVRSSNRLIQNCASFLDHSGSTDSVGEHLLSQACVLSGISMNSV